MAFTPIRLQWEQRLALQKMQEIFSKIICEKPGHLHVSAAGSNEAAARAEVTTAHS